MKLPPLSLHKGVLPPLLLLAAAFLLFANTFGNAWTYDDFPVIVNNPDVRSFEAFLTDRYPGRPLRELTYLLDHALFGLNPAGWHLQNIFWHGLGAALLFGLVRRLGAGVCAAWGAALIFLTHPLQVEVVASVSHRKDCLAFVFSLLSLHAYLTAFAPGRKRGIWLCASAALGSIAFLGKETAAALPMVFWAYEWLFVPTENRFLVKRPRTSAAFLGVGALGVSIWLTSFGGGVGYARGMAGLLRLRAAYEGEVALAAYVRTVLKSWGFLSGKILLPVDLALEYTYPVPSSWLDPFLLAGLGAAAACFIFFLTVARRYPLAAFALLWTAAFFLPVSNIWPLAYFAADRYLYAPMGGVGMLAGLGFVFLGKRRPVVGGAILLTVVCVFALLTWQQNRVWKTSTSLWSRAVAVSPTASFALNNLGWLYLEGGDEVRALTLLERAAQNRWNPNPQDNLAWLYERRGERGKALQYYLRFLKAAGDGPTYQDRVARVREHLRVSYGISFD